MVVINPNGGLGNQLFYYAVGVSLSKNRNLVLKFDSTAVSENPDRTLKFQKFIRTQLQQINFLEKKVRFTYKYFFLRKLLRIDEPVFVNEKSNWWEFPEDLKTKGKNIFVNGVFPFSEIIEPIISTLRNQISLKVDFHSSSFKRYFELIKSTNSVAIHIRKQDYTNEHYSTIFNSLPLSYYFDSIDLIRSEIENPHFFIFSDDPDYAKSNFSGKNIEIVSADSDLEDYHEFELMRLCKNYIIANSTFSWWAAKLSQSPNGIKIMPKTWFIIKEAQDAYERKAFLDISTAHKL